MSDASFGATSGVNRDNEESSVTDQLADTAASATNTVQEAASTVVDTAQQAAGAVVDKVQDVTGAVGAQVSRVTDAAADKVEQLADTVADKVISGDTPPAQRQVAQTTLNVLDRTAEYLREGDVNIVLEDLRHQIRRHPLRSLLLGLGAGYLARNAFFPGTSPQPRRQPEWRGGAGATPQPRTIPIYPDNTPTTYDVGYTGATMPTAVTQSMEDVGVSAATLGDTDTLTDTGLYGTDTLTDTGLYGAGTAGLGGDLSSDTSASTLYGSDTGLTGDTGGGMLDTDATSLDLGAPSLADVDADFTGGATAAAGDMDATTAGDFNLSSEEQFQVTNEADVTDQAGVDTMPTEDQLREWDANRGGGTLG